MMLGSDPPGRRQRGDPELAAKLLRAAVGRAAHDVFSWVELGRTLKQNGDTRGALRAFKEAQSRFPRMPDLKRYRQWILAAESMSKDG
jgi:cytochrome c-type biogenesis protein CcmH/NrfG